MTTDYCMIICFVMIGVNLVVVYSKLKEMNRLYTSWREYTFKLEKNVNNLYTYQRDDVKNLNRESKRIQALEDRLERLSALVATLEEKLNNSGGE